MSSPTLRTKLRIVHNPNPLFNRYSRLADNTAHLAQWAKGTPRFEEYKRVEESWRSLARTENWLLGRVSPLESGTPGKVPRSFAMSKEKPNDDPRQRTDWKPYPGTKEPWKEPGQQSQDPNSKAPPRPDLEKWRESNTH